MNMAQMIWLKKGDTVFTFNMKQLHAETDNQPTDLLKHVQACVGGCLNGCGRMSRQMTYPSKQAAA